MNGRITIEWFSICKDVVKNIWLCVLAALVGLMGIYIATHSVYSPEYTSSATIVVSAKGTGGGTSSIFSVSTELADIFSRIFPTPLMMSEAAKEMGVDSFDGKITATVLPETNFVEIRVTSDSPRKSYELLSAVLEVYPDVSKNSFGNAVVTLLKNPSMPVAPSNSISSENKSLAVAGCTFIVLAMIIVLSIMRDTVKTEGDFVDKIDSKLLIALPHINKRLTLKERLQKKKKGLLIDGNAYVSLRFVENFGKLAAKLEGEKAKHDTKVYAVTSITENEGKSTIASNMALALASRGYRVVLCDLDGEKPALYKIFNLKYKEKAELGALFNGDIDNKDYRLRKYRKTTLSLAVNTRAYPKETHKWIEEGRIQRVLASLKEQADFVIVDTAPLTGDASVTDILKIADASILTVRTDVVKTKIINDYVDNIRNVGGKLIGCVLNDVHTDFLSLGLSGAEEEGAYYYKHKKSHKGYGYGYGYGSYGGYGKYAYGKYGSNYGKYDYTRGFSDEREDTED